MAKRVKRIFSLYGREFSLYFQIIKKSEDYKRVLQLNKKLNCRHCACFYGWMRDRANDRIIIEQESSDAHNESSLERNNAISAQMSGLGRGVGQQIGLVKIGYIASKRLGGAVWRNGAKRRLRAALCESLQQMEQKNDLGRGRLSFPQAYLTGDDPSCEKVGGVHLLLVAKNSTVYCEFAELVADISYIIRKITQESAFIKI